jgi:MscS family membrane protein
MRELLASARRMLEADDRVYDNLARVRLIGLGEKPRHVEVFAYIVARDQDHFLEVQEELTLRIMDIAEEIGASFAIGSQTIYVARDRDTAGHQDPASPSGVTRMASIRI